MRYRKCTAVLFTNKRWLFYISILIYHIQILITVFLHPTEHAKTRYAHAQCELKCKKSFRFIFQLKLTAVSDEQSFILIIEQIIIWKRRYLMCEPPVLLVFYWLKLNERRSFRALWCGQPIFHFSETINSRNHTTQFHFQYCNVIWTLHSRSTHINLVKSCQRKSDK